MSILSTGIDRVSALSGRAQNLLGNPVATGIGGAVVGSLVTGAVARRLSSRKKTVKRVAPKKRNSKRTKRKRRPTKRKSYKYARTAKKRKDTSTRRIRMTKNGQPYVILASGKARFIKKSSARLSRKRKGGRY